MSLENGRRTPRFESLTLEQEIALRGLETERFRKEYLLFQEFEASRVLFQADLTKNPNGGNSIIFPYKRRCYFLPYERLDSKFEAIFRHALVSSVPVHRDNMVILRPSHNVPGSLKPYENTMVRAINNIYRLRSGEYTGRFIIQTDFLELGSNNPIAEVWNGIVINRPQPEQRVIYQSAFANNTALNTVVHKIIPQGH